MTKQQIQDEKLKPKSAQKNGKIIEPKDSKGRKRVHTVNLQASRTDQSYKEDCDANNIIRKYMKTGVLEHTKMVSGQYADVSDVPSLLAGMERIEKAKEDFLQIPSKIRSLFQNDVTKFYQYVSDPNNKDKCIELGLLPKPELPQNKPVEKAQEKKDAKDTNAS